MQVLYPPGKEPDEPDSDSQDPADKGPLARFRSWRGFLAAAVAVNALFAYGMIGNMADPSVSTWFKALVWLPFNAIATALYGAILVKLGLPGEGDHKRNRVGRMFYTVLCATLIVANWALMLFI